MPFHPWVQKPVNGIAYLASRYRTDRCAEISAALVYMSLFALVPLLTLTYTVGSVIPGAAGLQDQLQEFLVDNLLPEASRGVADYLAQFSQQAKNLTGVGLGILAVTAILMLRNIERAFNNIWHNRKNRGAVSSFLLYWAVLSLAPVIIAIVVGTQAYLYAAAHFITDLEPYGISEFLLSTVPYSLGALGLAALYLAVPNCSVPVTHALIGGFAVALALTIARKLFTLLIAKSSYTLIYGAFAAVPIFLLWLYITWNIILIGAIGVHGLSAYQSSAQAQRPLLLKTLDVLFLLWQTQQSGGALRELAILGDRSVSKTGIDSDSWRTIRDKLIDSNMIMQNQQGHYLLCVDPHNVSVADVYKLLREEQDLGSSAEQNEHRWQEITLEMLSGYREMRAKELSLSLADLFAAPRT
ncbi:MAG: YihY family inner membrane protein [Halieaceae bacterium]|jgi:membrane protein